MASFAPPKPTRMILCPLGSAGDVHPLIGLGVTLRRKGHEVLVLANEEFQPAIQAAGLEGVVVGTAAHYREVIDNPNLWNAFRGFEVLAKEVMLYHMIDLFEKIRDRVIPGSTVVAAPIIALGARVARDALGVPLVSMAIQPAILRSLISPPRIKWLPIRPGRPIWWNRFWFRYVDLFVVDRIIRHRLNAFRASLKLPKVGRVADWWCSPDGIVGLFPEWYAPPALDWPPRTVLTDFPRFDRESVQTSSIAPEIEEFFPPRTADGHVSADAPVLLTAGSAMRQGDSFFEVGLSAVERLGRPAALLTKYPDQLPSSLPSFARHFRYVPFSTIFPRVAAVVHHGGIGTTAQALAAGTPQVIMPMSHDQFDNADRVRSLGVGVRLEPNRFNHEKVFRALDGVTKTPAVQAACRAQAERFHQSTGLERACEILEQAQFETSPNIIAHSRL